MGSIDASRDGMETFKSLPTSGRFMSLMAGPPKIGGHFTLVAGK